MVLLPLIVNIQLIMRILLMNPKSLVKYLPDLKIIAVAFIYYLSAWVGYVLAFKETTALPTWPPSGIAFAMMILLGRSAWPGIVIGSLLANLMAYWNSAALPAHAIIGVSCMIAAANTAEALVGNFLVKKWIKNDYPFTITADAFRFLFVALLMSGAGAAIGAIGMLMNQVITSQEIVQTALSWAIGNAVAILLFTPFILACFRFLNLPFSKSRVFELGVLIVFAASLFLVLQLDYSHPTLERALPFLILPFLLWLAFRFELFIAMGGVICVSLVSIYVTIHNDGPFFLEEPAYSMPLLQIFISVMSVSAIVLAATVRERTEAQTKLLEFNETLEAKVHVRTQALYDEIQTRTVAEQKLQKTNQELSKRNNELDNFVYSVSHDLRAPIASVLGLINLAKKDADPTMKDVYLDMINNSAKLQDHFIREILDQSRNSRLEIKREEIFFGPIIEETFNQLRFATATDQSVERIINVKQEKPFYCDSWRLKVILNNIISNSIRYRNGKDPVIEVNVDVTKGGAQLNIKDNGRGIAKEHLNNVCKMFYRATDDGAGSGLGLYIVKETIDKLNGSIRIDSELGKGTLVKLNIPEVV
jgi:signal transduction histidine kinase